MDEKQAQSIVNKINGWKTIIGAIGTPIASMLILLTPDNTLAHQISVGFTVLFGVTGITGVAHKIKKGELPNQLPGGLADKK